MWIGIACVTKKPSDADAVVRPAGSGVQKNMRLQPDFKPKASVLAGVEAESIAVPWRNVSRRRVLHTDPNGKPGRRTKRLGCPHKYPERVAILRRRSGGAGFSSGREVIKGVPPRADHLPTLNHHDRHVAYRLAAVL